MNKKSIYLILIIYILFFSSCLGQRKAAIIPIPDTDTEFFDFTLPIKMEDILESKNGTGTVNLPRWLRAYLSGGIEEIEKIPAYNGKYIFIGMSEGMNFSAMGKWAENFSPLRDTTMLAAKRIEKKLITSAALYPDDEYGEFFEVLVKNAYGAVYPGTMKEDTYWIKINSETDMYVFFVLISVDISDFQNVVHEMIATSIQSSSLTRDKRNAVNRLQQNFFEGF